ncbi:13357_t:CDS:2, partial [Cetraspora pellucida]
HVFIALKDPIFEASSLLYRGSDYCINYLSVQISLIALYLSFDLNYLVVVRTPPGHFWKNPVERVILILSLEF